MTSPVIVGQVNLRNLLEGSEDLQKILDTIPEIYGILQDQRDIVYVTALISDAQAKIDLALYGLQGIQTALSALIDTLMQTFDISYHQLLLTDTPIAGGLSSYLNVFNANLKNQYDSNRPYDEGGASMVAVMFIVNYQNMFQARQAAQEIAGMFKYAEQARLDALKGLIGVTDYKELVEEFWGHYLKKQIAGTHATVQGNWQKYSVGDLFPDIAQPLNDWLEALKGKWIPQVNAYLLAERLKAMFNKIIDFLGRLVVIIDAWKKLLLDTSVTVIITPIVTGSVSDDGGIYSAQDNLAFYTTTIAQQIRNQQFTNLSGGITGTDYSAIVRQDNFCAGVNMVFKAPSAEAAVQQMNAVFRLWGLGSISLGIEEQANQYLEQNIG